MSYTVLARRYRSRSFDEVVGQEPIARTLRHAIESGRTAHAYLFCGTRGVGKTSMARIFAKAINVADDLEEAEAIGEAILRGDDLDVIEIDGASNRGIQEARDLIAAAGLSPARCPCKVYIIDEVHMLTREAFNALLKTMEEPPDHVKFILCTTEPHKVPATIQSRCQRFDFRPIPSARIAEHLRVVLAAEGVGADDDLVGEVARLGHGSMRDALSLLDRLLAAGESPLTMPLLEQMVGVPDHAQVESVIDAVIEGDAAAALDRGAALLAGGVTVEQALELVTGHLHALLVVAACGPETELLEASEERRSRAAAQARHFDAPGLVHMIALCDAVARNARGTATARALFDAALVRMCQSHRIADVSALLAGGAGAPAPGARGGAAAKKKEGASLTPPPAEPPRPAPAPASTVTEVKGPAAPVADDRLWEAVCAFAAGSRSDQARVEHLRLEAMDGGTLRLRVAETGQEMARFLGTQASQIADLVKRATGRAVRVRIDTAHAGARPAADLPESVLEEVRAHPAVAEAAALFDATIIDVKEAGDRCSTA